MHKGCLAPHDVGLGYQSGLWIAVMGIEQADYARASLVSYSLVRIPHQHHDLGAVLPHLLPVDQDHQGEAASFLPDLHADPHPPCC